MWRRYGDVPYTFLVFAVFCIEVLGLGFLTWSFSRRLFGLVPHTEVEGILVGAVALTGAALVMLTGYVLVYHVLSAVREQHSADRVAAWTERWVRAVYGEEPFPRRPLPAEGEEAGLALRDLLAGEEGQRLAEGLWESGIADELLRRLDSSRLTVRMEALDALAKARLSGSLGRIRRAMRSPHPMVRLMAARAGARTLAGWWGPGRDDAGASFAAALVDCDLPVGAAGETLMLLEGAAPAVLARLLSEASSPVPVLRAALDAVGRLRLVELAYDAGTRVTHRDREVRAAALRALGRLARVPARTRDAVVIALADDTEFVRVQAARAAAFVPADNAVTALYGSLGDRSWWVRRASAESLLHIGKRGLSTLAKAAREHPDRYARDMAAQVLLDSDLVLRTEVPALRGTA